MKFTLKLSGQHHAALKSHLLQDANEAAALVLCGRCVTDSQTILIGQKVVLVPLEACVERHPDYLHWRTDAVESAFEEAAAQNLSVLKIHSHPGGYASFSRTDDASDKDLFPSLYGWTNGPHASAVMLPDGSIFGRHVSDKGRFVPIRRVAVAGDDIQIWDDGIHSDEVPMSANRHARAFGAATTLLLKRLKIAVVGCSGTGSVVIEQLGRLQVGELVLIDPECAEDVNSNRIMGLTADDVARRRLKVEVLKRTVEAMGHGTRVTALPLDVMTPAAIKAVAECDLVFGCMDSASGRHVLNKLAATYCLPYIDVGVRLVADGVGNISHVCGSVNYLQPGGSSLLSRGLYDLQDFEAEMLQKGDPEAYKVRLAEKYIKGVQESRPAVVSVNTVYAGLAVTEMLARLHPFRDDPNERYAATCLSLNGAFVECSSDGDPCPVINRHAGKGDMEPLLGMQF